MIIKKKKRRLMLPFDVTCKLCKFNNKKGRKVNGMINKLLKKKLSEYLFYFKCSNCKKSCNFLTNIDKFQYIK
ncbi:hypothetical protein (nucleomorph) [Guillardia theta]|uniref:Uncharacterized protein n=1 Tax=Guillardia theta TaxID=55529 RepID=Q98S32_GUITH|nr:hypothetical protein GTHECHR3104 [Guillardia theta]AAK39748.1 hypothetical protein [Guillardia theta]